MAGVRRFLIASSLARIIRKERGVEARIVEGHFPGQFGRTHFVSIEPGHAFLVLTDVNVEGGLAEERAEVPPGHAEALLEVAGGRIGYERSRVPLGEGLEAVLSRFMQPSGLDVLTVVFEDGSETFAPPIWFGPEVTGDPAWQRHTIALSGPPEVPNIALINQAVEALLRTIESPAGAAARLGDWLARGSRTQGHELGSLDARGGESVSRRN